MSKKNNLFFSVVIPAYERPVDLKRCLKSLDHSIQCSDTEYEIIVTDDSRTGSCKEIILKDFPEVSWGFGKYNGPAGNRNAGVNRANGNWIIFIDDDCVADRGYINAYYNAIQQNPHVVLFEGFIYPDRPRKTWAECCPENTNGGMFWTSNLCVKKNVFNEIGGFDERFRVAYEDIDFAHRITNKNYETKFIKEAAVCHPWRTLKNEGNNWKPRGFEISELLLFIDKHPFAKQHNSPVIYLRNLMRMISSDLWKCIIVFRGKGLTTLFYQISSTAYVAWITLWLKFRKLYA
jgi:GT2 family glycosyltransferase